ncbi:hypothetical protein EYF80_023540 [Liparis tanakae]|uniref:Uncharacterized protein n=1 Tax=Liparis tanakae TaxID=230148 RepID=A0A4Z2HKS9_9TELE|nr:hypothetical protein EYF80_023540 [Liparis tanakae]
MMLAAGLAESRKGQHSHASITGNTNSMCLLRCTDTAIKAVTAVQCCHLACEVAFVLEVAGVP